ncbi:MAG TPA: TIGR00159 family protein [Candidatus Cloacimonas sp.]|jgi:diadenylate cyclase|nr:diadenylate cyclase [Candidatus Cloacimonadota bacterium]HCX72852.1 TIGR00159 family protein [Candidatus Cloacimonas sp.]
MSFLVPNLTDIIDILMVAFILYNLIILFRRTGGFQILLGLGVVLLMYFVASLMKLEMMTTFLRILKDYWVIVFVVIFHPEIRSIFRKAMTSKDVFSFFRGKTKKVNTPLLNAISILSFRKIGALIVLENNRKLDHYVETGEIIDARISTKLILTIFNNKTILHDGAAIIRGERIWAVKVVLPLSENLEYTQKFGTRHLAAIGISEETDAFVIVVSEETGRISVAKNGEIFTALSLDELSQRIKDAT